MWTQHFQYALRRLSKSPSFALFAIVTLGVGIGANTAVFSVVYDVLLKPLRFSQPQQLVVVQESIQSADAAFSQLPVNANHLVYWQKHTMQFSGLAAMLPASMPLGARQPEEIAVARQTANLLNVLGVSPRLGRAFRSEEDQPGHNNVIILADSLWRRRYGADPNVIGKSATLDGRSYEIVGVMGPLFTLPALGAIGKTHGANREVEAFVPFGWGADVLEEVEGDHNYFAIGRLRSGASVAAASSELQALQGAISQQTPDKVRYGAAITPLQEYLTGSRRRSLLLVLAAVGALLYLSCINIANVLLTRASSSSREVAIRTDLGASRRNLVSAALAEPVILAAFGCVLGILLAEGAAPLILRNVPPDLARVDQFHVNLVAFGFAVALSTLVALLCGLLPARKYAAESPESVLRSETGRATYTKATKGLRSGLVVAEVGASLALIMIAGLFLASMAKLLHVDRGFQSEHVLSAEILLPAMQYQESSSRIGFYDRALAKLRGVPGIQAVGLVSVLPLNGDYWGDIVSRAGDTRPLWQRNSAHFRWISPGYFEALRVPLLAGRSLSDKDKNRRSALISAQVARSVWRNQSALGQKFRRGNPGEEPFEVVGIVGDLRSLDLGQPAPPMVYVPYWYRSREVGTFVVRTSGDPEQLMTTVRKIMSSMDPQLAVTSLQTMETVVSGSVAARRFEMQLLLTVAAIALLLAGLGVYGVVAYATAQRTHEIGIRMALGADRGSVRLLILRERMKPVAAGAAIGLGVAWLAGRFLTGLLFEVSALDPLIASCATLLLLTVGVVACVLPARQATRVEPLVALHHE